MSQAFLGGFNGTVTPGVNMLDIFKERELEANPNSILKYGNMVIRKFGISCPAGTNVKINGRSIKIFSGIFEVGIDQIDIISLEFESAVDVNIYYMY